VAISFGSTSSSAKTEHHSQLMNHDQARDDDVEIGSQHQETSKEKDYYLVDWDENDQANPRNWSNGYKSWITFQLGMLALAASLGSSIIAPAENAISAYTGVSHEVAVLSISLYVLGFAFGPLCWAPVSEQFGRRWSLLPAMVCLGLFSIGTATSKNITSILVTRFFGGLFGSAPVSNVAAALGDVWAPRARGMAVTFYAVAVVGGPTLGPTIGAALTVNKHLGWRWTEYIEAIWVFAATAMAAFTMPELYAPVLLHRKAIKMRKETGDDRYHHPHEDIKLDFNSIVTKHLVRPLRMLLTEPMVTCIAIYASFVFGLLYLTLEVFSIVFQEMRGYSLVVSTLPFLALFVGVLAAMGINLANQPRYIRLVNENGGKPVPEGRLLPMVVGGVLFAVGLFWFGWTADPK
jgi:MFS family permease